MTLNASVHVTLLKYYNAFRVDTCDYTAYWYDGPDKHVCTEDPDELVKQLGDVEEHNAKVITFAAANQSAFYYSNTKFQNIIARSDGMYRDFGVEEVVMYPIGYDFDAKIEEYEDFITSILVAPWQETETY